MLTNRWMRQLLPTRLSPTTTTVTSVSLASFMLVIFVDFCRIPALDSQKNLLQRKLLYDQKILANFFVFFVSLPSFLLIFYQDVKIFRHFSTKERFFIDLVQFSKFNHRFYFASLEQQLQRRHRRRVERRDHDGRYSNLEPRTSASGFEFSTLTECLLRSVVTQVSK